VLRKTGAEGVEHLSELVCRDILPILSNRLSEQCFMDGLGVGYRRRRNDVFDVWCHRIDGCVLYVQRCSEAFSELFAIVEVDFDGCGFGWLRMGQPCTA
jgi:hypothetical protein